MKNVNQDEDEFEFDGKTYVAKEYSGAIVDFRAE